MKIGPFNINISTPKWLIKLVAPIVRFGRRVIRFLTLSPTPTTSRRSSNDSQSSRSSQARMISSPQIDDRKPKRQRSMIEILTEQQQQPTKKAPTRQLSSAKLGMTPEELKKMENDLIEELEKDKLKNPENYSDSTASGESIRSLPQDHYAEVSNDGILRDEGGIYDVEDPNLANEQLNPKTDDIYDSPQDALTEKSIVGVTTDSSPSDRALDKVKEGVKKQEPEEKKQNSEPEETVTRTRGIN